MNRLPQTLLDVEQKQPLIAAFTLALMVSGCVQDTNGDVLAALGCTEEGVTVLVNPAGNVVDGTIKGDELAVVENGMRVFRLPDCAASTYPLQRVSPDREAVVTAEDACGQPIAVTLSCHDRGLDRFVPTETGMKLSIPKGQLCVVSQPDCSN